MSRSPAPPPPDPALRFDDDVVVSGWGVWSAAGTSASEFAHQVLSGRGPRAITRIGPGAFPALAAPDPPACPRFPQAHRMDRSVHLALAAATETVATARLETVDPTRIAILVGNSRGPAGKWSATAASSARVRPTQAANTAIASLSGALSLAFQVQGPCLTVSAACASAAHAIALGAALLRTGEADVVLAGGAEAPLVGPLLDQFLAAGILGSHTDPARTCRPFDRTRNGTVPGEGAAFLALESAAHARARNVPALAVLAGYAVGSEAHNRVATRADGAGLARVIRQALDRAGLSPGAIGYVNAHGTGTRVNDLAEAAALDAVFGSAGPRPAVSSTKPVLGHAFGAAPALEAIVALECLRAQKAPPTWACVEPDPELRPLDLILKVPRPLSTRAVLSTSLGFWGNTAALVFRTVESSLRNVADSSATGETGATTECGNRS